VCGNAIAKFLYAKLFIIVLLILFLPLTASAFFDSGASLHIVAKNMPQDVCYIDILRNYSFKSEGKKIRGYDNCSIVYYDFDNSEKYNQRMIRTLKNYNDDGWRAVAVSQVGTILGDIVCDVKDGKCVVDFTSTMEIDKFKIIVVTADGSTVVSNVIERKAFDSIIFFDFMTEEATELPMALSFWILFFCNCLKALVVEGLVLLMFRFGIKSNYKPFLAINVFTQAFLSLLLSAVMYSRGRVEALLVYLLLELIIFAVEIYLYANFLEQHSKLRRVLFALTANILSFAAGIALIKNHRALWELFLQL